jgi:chromosome segregation ATPase
MDSILDQKTISDNNIEDINDDVEEFESIPLPNQLPDQSAIGPESRSSTHFNKSRTVQTLISQNQDLMARLTVALKRNIELEQKIESQEELYASLCGEYDILKDSSAIHQEKNKRLEFENQRLFDQGVAAEKRFAELYSSHQEKISTIDSLNKTIYRFSNYRARILGYVRPLISRLKHEVVDLKNQILILKEQDLSQLEIIGDLKSKLSQTLDHLQAITLKAQKDQSDLVDYHETRYQNISKELELLKVEAHVTKEQNSELKKQVETLLENETSLSNKSIFYERKYSDLKNEFEKISQEFIQRRTADTGRITNLEIQLKEISSHLAQTADAKAKFEVENQSLNDQLQSLQIIYQDSFAKLEALQKKLSAQDQINKELSQALTESRKKLENSEEKLIQSEEDFKRKLHAFQVRFNKNAPFNISTASLENTQSGQKDLLNKIQTLLSEIQTGHAQISNIGFEESFDESKMDGDELISEHGDLKSP